MKNKYTIVFILFIFIALPLQAQKYKYYKNIMTKDQYKELPDGLYANLETTDGNMLVELYPEKSPLTVANFVGLAEGTQPNKVKAAGVPFYDGTTFHRIIKNFMIQGGDPQGTGAGGPGYDFQDEKNDLKHDGKGILSMANSGPNTNGSQFFITEVATPWLDGKHTIFGKVIKGVDVIDTIANSPTGAQDRPVKPIDLNHVTIVRKGKEYAKYNGGEEFKKQEGLVAERQAAYEKAQKEKMAKLQEGMQTTPSGLKYKITKDTSGATPKNGDKLTIHYEGMLEDGTIFDSSYTRNQPIEVQANSGRMIKGFDEALMLLKEGEVATIYIPSDLAYGASGAGGVIPPNANIIFTVELVKIN